MMLFLQELKHLKTSNDIMRTEFNEKYNFYHILSDEGMVVTDWNGEDIKEYSSSTELYCPPFVDLSRFYEVSLSSDMMYREAQEKAFKSEING